MNRIVVELLLSWSPLISTQLFEDLSRRILVLKALVVSGKGHQLNKYYNAMYNISHNTLLNLRDIDVFDSLCL